MKNLFLFFVALPVFAFGATFEKWYGGDSLDGGYVVCQTPDGGYIAVGYTKSFGQGEEDVYIIRTDSLGDTLWTKTYGSPLKEMGLDIFPTNDGYGIVGVADGILLDIYFLRINSSGDTLWTKKYDNAGGVDFGYKGAITPDNGYIIIGCTSMLNTRMYAIKTDSSGDVLWTKQYGAGNEDQYGLSLDLTPDGGYIFSGVTGKITIQLDAYLVKTDSVGAPLWARKYGGAGDEWAYDVDLTSDNGFLIVGNTTSFTPDTPDVYVMKVTLQGDTLWTRHYGGSYGDAGCKGLESSDGGYVISGYTSSFGSGTPQASNAYIIKIDNTGNLLWERAYGDTTEDFVFSGVECSDKGFIFAGRSRDDFYLLKTDSTGNMGVEEDSRLKITDYRLEVSPNPCYGWVDIKYEIKEPKDVKIVVYDVAGRIVDYVFKGYALAGDYSIRYKTTELAPGIYFISLDLSMCKQKLIILK